MPRLSLAAPAFVLAALPLLAGCAGGPAAASGDYAGAEPRRIVLDGRLDEWPGSAAALADDSYVYFRLRTLGPDGRPQTLQASDETVTLLLDCDADAMTGARLGTPRDAASLGVDLSVEFSPRRGVAHAGRGVAAYVHDAAGYAASVPHAALDLSFAPTFAAEWYEGRLSRFVEHPGGSLASRLAGTGRARGMFLLTDADGHVVGWSDMFHVELPPAGPGRPQAEPAWPARTPGTIRVATYNVAKARPNEAPDPFARTLQAIDPDIVLVQEWDGATAGDLEGWLSAHVGGAGFWYARTSAGHGVAVLSRYPLDGLGPERLEVAGEEGSSRAPVRFAGALAHTPLGALMVASLHLKCCGSSGSVEDATRMSEAAAVNAAMRDARQASGASMMVLGGDLNLVGSRAPIDALREGLGADGSDLEAAEAFVLGDAAQYTWAEATAEFTPGRLDYLLVDASSARITRAFVLDTARLGDGVLASAGLDRADSSASDHRVVVVDIRPR